MTDNPKWMVEAAREIAGALGLIGLDALIIPAIAKHCLEDKAGKLVEALQKITPSYTTVKNRDLYDRDWYQCQYDKLQKIAEDALAEYESDSGHVIAEDKEGKLVEALRELLTSIVEDWGISERYKARRKVEAALADYEGKK